MAVSTESRTAKTSDLPLTGLDRAGHQRIYTLLLKTRLLDERMRKLFKQGRFAGTYFSAVGQEATTVVICSQLRKDDVLAPSHRELGGNVAKGVPLEIILGQVYANTLSPDKGHSHPVHFGSKEHFVIQPASTVASSLILGVGAALAFKIRGEDRIAVGFTGDGGTSRGDFHEALNFAGVQKLGFVCIVQNNLWAESVPLKLQAGITDLSKRAEAYGFPGISVDGNDVVEVNRVTREAVERARSGGGPTLIECKTYRWYGHSEIDPANYRPPGELEAWKAKDPIPRFEKVLQDLGLLTPEEKERITKALEQEIEEAVQTVEKAPPPKPEQALEDVYSTSPRYH
jgi:TPP-dependent pyruvate/acetoin dehydrogenase alpha subunit